MKEETGTKTYTTKMLFEDSAVRDYWSAQMSVVRDAYNYISAIVFAEKTPLGRKTFQKRFYREVREKFPRLTSQMTIEVIVMVRSNYKTVQDQAKKEKKAKEREEKRRQKKMLKKGKKAQEPAVVVAPAPKPEDKKEPEEEFLTEPIEMKNPAMGLDKRLFSNMTDESFRITHGLYPKRSLVRFEVYPKFLEMCAKYRKRDPKMVYDEQEKEFYLCVPFEIPLPEALPEKHMGVDLGIKRDATLSDGTAFSDKEYLAMRRRLRHNKSIFRRHKKHSHSARRKLNRLSRRENNMSDNHTHELANWILAHDATVFVLEDLTRIKRNTSRTEGGRKRKRHNNMMSQVAFYKLKQILTYKAPLLGKRVETVSPHDTSQMDCRSQSKEGCRRQGCRFYTADGMVFDADWNASVNIVLRKHPVSFRLPLDGRLNLTGRRRQHANRGSGQPDLQAAMSSAWRQLTLPKDLTNEEQIFVLRFKKLFHAVSNEDMLHWAVFHVDWKIPYPDFPVFNDVNVPPGTDPAVAKAEWDKEEQSLKAKLWKRMFSGDEEILAIGPREN